MRMQFSFVIEAKADVEKRFLEKLQKQPTLQMNIIHGFGNLLSLALDATPEDNLSLIGFNAGKIPDESPKENVEANTEGKTA